GLDRASRRGTRSDLSALRRSDRDSLRDDLLVGRFPRSSGAERGLTSFLSRSAPSRHGTRQAVMSWLKESPAEVPRESANSLMKLRGSAAFALLLLWLIPTGVPAQAQTRPFQVDSGTVVRLQLRSGVREKGRLLSPYAPDSSRVRYCHYPAPSCSLGDERYREQPASDLSAVEVRRGSARLA